jgi:aminoglycoside phosphotransferase (APT) family kinase protein
MTRLHADEVAVDDRLVHRLLRSQFPHLAELPLRRSPVQGTDNLMFRLGDDLAVRLPRQPSAVPGLLVERGWLPRLAPLLPCPVPVPIAAGQPGQLYPFPWAVCRWIGGRPVPPGGLGPRGAAALGGFVAALQSVPTADGPLVPSGQRAGPLHAYDDVAQRAIDTLEQFQAAGRFGRGLIDQPVARAIWSTALAAPPWPRPPVWVHRDLLGSNLVSVGDRLAGVLDFGGLAVGDPAGDLMAAFHVLPPELHSGFRAALGTDEATWQRARGWALIQGVEAAPYYLNTHPGMVAMARHVLGAVAADFVGGSR